MDDYTPYGYLDNPAHTARLNPSGVLRSQPAVGFAWHYPAFAGPYSPRRLYRAALRLAVFADQQTLLTPEDFVAAGITLVSRSHSKDIMSFDWSPGPVLWRAAFFLHDEHALCCLLTIRSQSPTPAALAWAFLAEYERDVAAGPTWDCGLLARWRPDTPALALLPYPEGEAFVCLADLPPARHAVATVLADLLPALRDPATGPDLVATPPASGPTSVSGALYYQASLRPGEQLAVLAALGRGPAESRALSAARGALAAGRDRHARLAAAEAAFRQRCPQLSGDWPAHWRRGFVYDLETLRAVVRPPRGIYRHPWDGMQLQSPRSVLAEAALDALVLSYAAPDLAQQVLLGAFADSPAPNVPCTREDGSYNMLAEDGAPCGTAPEWCFPLLCADLLYRRTADRPWLRRLYPYLARYLDWWLHHRTDAGGYLHYHCSWESGQDESPRFGPQASGGTLIAHVRPVDLHAAVALGAAVLARFAADLSRPRAAARWQRLARRYAALTQTLWQGDWFCDFDAGTGAPLPFRDVMHLAPLLAGLATPDQLATLRPAFADLPPHGIWPPLDWPPVVFTAVEAASAAGWHDLASALAVPLVDRVYRAYDARPFPSGPFPGVASECWATSGSWGCEGYGWGALSTLLVIRHVLGWQEQPDGAVALHPALPAGWLAPGRRFAVGPLHHRGADLHLTYRCLVDDILEVDLTCSGPLSVTRVLDPQAHPLPLTRDNTRLRFPARNSHPYHLAFSSQPPAP